MAGKIYEDSRQQKGKHKAKHDWWDAHGVEVERIKLDFGDYMAADGSSNISIDTKKGISEVAMDVGHDHKRFVRELDRAAEAGHRLIVLVETTGPIHCIDDVAGWTSTACRMCEQHRFGYCSPVGAMHCRKYRHKPMQGGTVAKMMRTLEDRHSAKFEFVHPLGCARTICDILGVGYDG